MKKNQNNNIYAHSPQYYKKVNGEYIPANDSYALDGLEEGCWMVIVKPGSKSIRSLIRPEFKNLIAALRYLEDGLVSEMSKKSQMRPYATPMSPKEIKA